MESLGLRTRTSLVKSESFGTESEESDDDGVDVGEGTAVAVEQKNENGPRLLSIEK